MATDSHLDRLDVARTHRGCVGGGLADGQHHAVSPGMAAGSCCKAGSHATPQPGKACRRAGNRDFQLSPAAGVAVVMAWWRVLQARVEQLPHRTNVGAAWRQPSRAPRQSSPALTVTGRCGSGGAALHRPLGPPQPVQLRRQRPGAVLQILQVAVAVERPPVNAAGPAAPVAGLGGARTGVVGLRPAAASVGLVEPRAGRDADLPGPARLPAAHEPSPPGLVAGLRPTHQAGGHGQAGAASRAHRTLRRSGLPGTVWSGRDPKATVLCPQIRSASGRPYAGALTRQVWPVDQAISPSPGASRDVAGGKPLGRPAPEPRGPRHQQPTAMVVPGSHRSAVRHGPGAAGRKSSLGRAGRSQ
jgi:hypothetical protein